jgi:hypothetical protein
MTQELSRDAMKTLQRYRDGRLSDNELDRWLTETEYDDDVSRGERDRLALLRLFLIEAGEGLRPKQELLDEISSLLARPRRRRRTTRVKN